MGSPEMSSAACRTILQTPVLLTSLRVSKADPAPRANESRSGCCSSGRTHRRTAASAVCESGGNESLRRLAAAHGLDLKNYLDEVATMIQKSDRS